MSEYIVEMLGIVKRFPGLTANDHVTLQIKKGEVFALLGENGAGKSTLMSMLFGMYEPDEGEIRIRGKQEQISSSSYAAKLNIGMVHQHFKLVSEYTITQNIIMGMEPEKKLLGLFPYVDLKRAEEEVARLSEKYGLKVNPSMRISDADVAIQQRTEILKMLYRNSEILIFDEPTAVLTPQEIKFLLGIILELKRQGKTILLITHKLSEMKRVADRCAILCRGKLTGIRNAASTTAGEMANLMVGREVSLKMKKNPARYGANVLEISRLSIENKERRMVVKDVSFTIRSGEIFAIAGVSGNGQIEIADTIAGLVKSKYGKIILNGRDITNKSIRERILAGIAYIPEDRQRCGLIMDFTLEENMGLKGYFRAPFSKRGILEPSKFYEYSTKLIQDYDVRCTLGNKTIVRSMSGGNQQKALIGREIEQESSLMIFVQPTRGLDIGAIEHIHRQMQKERDRGKAILLISLELDEVMDCADTIGVIYDGELMKIAPAQTLTAMEVGQFMMGVKGEAVNEETDVHDSGK